MTFEGMTTIQFFQPVGRWRETCIKICRNLLHIVIGWLAGLLGMRLVDREAKLLPDGCRAIPAGHFNFDPGMVEFFGGKDGLNKAVVYQRFMAWIESNRLAGRNIWNGQPHTYNTYEQWAEDIHIFHPKTIQKHVRDFEAMGLLSSHQPWKSEGKCVKHYTSPLRLTDNPQQMLPGWEDKTLRVVAEDSDLSTTQYPTKHKPSTRKAKTTPTPAPAGFPSVTRGRKSLTAGGVAEFPKHNPNLDMPEKKTDIPEGRPESDEHEQFTNLNQKVDAANAQNTPLVPRVPPCPTADEPPDQDESTEIETASSGNTPVIDVPEWMPGFFTGCTTDELMQILHRFGESVLIDAKVYALDAKNKIDNPPGYVRARLAKGWMPPVRQEAKSYHQDWMDDSYENEPSAYLRWVVSDECPFLPTFKADAREILEARERAGV